MWVGGVEQTHVTGSDPAEESRSDAGESRSDAGDEAYVRELEQYRRRLDGAMFAGDLAWWEMDVETGAVQFHENKAAMLGLSPADFHHYEDFTERVHPDDHDRAMEAMAAHLEGRAEKYDAEYRIRTASGDYRWFRDIGGVTERTADGAPASVTGVVVDVTRRKEVESKLREKNAQLSLLNRIVRHDIRNDMQVLTGWADVLDDDLSSEQRAHLDRIVQAGEHTIELTSDVGDLLQMLDSDAESIDLESVDLQRIVETEVERVRASFDDVEIRIETEAPAVAVEANGLLSSVVGNLLNNAVQHNDGDVARIDVEIEDRGETVVLRIADDGPGIPAERRENIFRRSTKGAGSEGTGVGLFLVETLVDAFGGDVRVEPNEPRGSVFSVELVRASAD